MAKNKTTFVNNTGDKTIPVQPMKGIERFNCKTKGGNSLQFFYNPDNNLVVIDLCNDNGGNELFRGNLDEKKLLAHLNILI
jgi:hypothetical protein